jgi:acetyl-CoA carboxylase beta subunit
VIAAFNSSSWAAPMGVRGRRGAGSRRPAGRAAGSALIGHPASGGARMQEGILSLMQMPRNQ